MELADATREQVELVLRANALKLRALRERIAAGGTGWSVEEIEHERELLANADELLDELNRRRELSPSS